MLVVLDVRTEMIGDEYDIARVLAAYVHAAAEHNLVLLEHHPGTPRLLDTALRFVPEPEKLESIKSIPWIIESGGTDCASWTAWRLAENWLDELRQFKKRFSNAKVYWRDRCKRCNQIVDPRTTAICPRCGQFLPGNIRREFHAQLRNRNGIVEDTSRLLGM